jgi:hypothetical protein
MKTSVSPSLQEKPCIVLEFAKQDDCRRNFEDWTSGLSIYFPDADPYS